MIRGGGGKVNLYDVYEEEIKILSAVTCREASERTGCDTQRINRYAATGYNYNNNGKKYRFVNVGYITADSEKPQIQPYEREKPIQMDPDFPEEWDKWRKLALKALRSPAAIRRYRARKVS